MAHDCVTEFRPECDRCVDHDTTCGRRCIDCDERICDWFGPESVPRCSDHPTCEGCADEVTCPECALILAEVERDRRAQAAYDVAREAS